MNIASGTRLGAYEILSAIGAGGMGEVYRARDAKLGRDVAIEVLPEAFARDAERMAAIPARSKSPCVAQPSQHRGHLRLRGFRQTGKARYLQS
jgi:eukaryotic-like serine/threonine-protein kinase